MKQETCKECPWKRSNPHSLKWRKWAARMFETGVISEVGHACHMKSKDPWGAKSGVNIKTRCSGQNYSSQSSSSSSNSSSNSSSSSLSSYAHGKEA